MPYWPSPREAHGGHAPPRGIEEAQEEAANRQTQLDGVSYSWVVGYSTSSRTSPLGFGISVRKRIRNVPAKKRSHATVQTSVGHQAAFTNWRFVSLMGW